MAKEHRISVQAHPNVYVENPNERILDIVYAEPEQGINDETGMLLLIASFGETMDSPSFQEARSYFSDRHNMVTVQCRYFGQEYMQDSRSVRYAIDIRALQTVFTAEEVDQVYDGVNLDNLNIHALLQIGQKYPIHLDGNEIFEETEQEFNDMGLMQAVDQLTAMFAVRGVLRDNGRVINRQRIHAYCQGHGAFLAYLCNALAPKWFSRIIDNSAWLFPSYLKSTRQLRGQMGNMVNVVIFDYLAAKLPYDEELLHLPSLYKLTRNHARIISYHGTEDFTPTHVKKAFCDSLRLCNFYKIGPGGISDDLLGSNEQGQGVNFLKLYDYTVEQNAILGELQTDGDLAINRFETKMYRYSVDFSSEMPLLTRIKK